MIDYLVRLATTSALSITRSKAAILDEVRTPMRAWLSDIDINRHVNNGRYLTLMDFARLDHSIRTGMLSAMVKRKWWPIMGGATVNFRREIKPLMTFDLTTKLLAYDDKWLYGEHRFEKDGVVHATAFARAVIKKGRQTIPPAELMQVMGYSGPPLQAPQSLQQWMAMAKS